MTKAAIVKSEDQEVTVLTRWEAVAADIAIATEKSEGLTFDYQDKSGNRAARSWVSQLRKLRAEVDRVRKEAKAVHIQRGKAVDETAKTLETAVTNLIEPHDKEIKAIEAIEQARVDAHRVVLNRIQQLSENISFSAQASASIEQIQAIDTDLLEEFSEAGASRKKDAIERLRGLYKLLLAQEQQKAELDALRAEKEAREAADREAQLKREAAEEERNRQERIRQQEAREAAQREAAALQAKEAAEKRAAEAEARELERLKRDRELEEKRQQTERAREDLALKLESEIEHLIRGLSTQDIARLIIRKKLHPAIEVDWSKVERDFVF
jgi:hypothetical protein